MCSGKLSSLIINPLSTSSRCLVSRQLHLNPKPISVSSCPEEPVSYAIQFISNHPNPEISCFPFKGFSEITKEFTLRALHAVCVKGLLRISVFQSNTLLNMYAKFGRIEDARRVFDNMPEKNITSWNTMMSGFAKGGFYPEAFGFLNEMRGFGVEPSGVVMASLITSCDRSAYMFDQGLQAHGLVAKLGLLCDVYVGTSLLHFYGTYGLVYNATKIFEEMPQRNVVSWTSLMVGYLDNGKPREVTNAYQHMRSEGLSCNQNTYTVVLTSCGMLNDELLGHQVFGDIIKFGFETNVSVGNSVMSMFSTFGRMEEARYVFDRMDERDIITWNSMISASSQNGLCEESLRCFSLMRHDHGVINSTTLSSLLSVCGSVDNLKWGRGIHGLVKKLGLDSTICVGNTLLCMYSDAGRSEDAELQFQEMPERDVISWNSMIATYVQDENSVEALRILAKMLSLGKQLNYVTLTSALAACSNHDFVVEGKSVHAMVTLSGLQDNLIVGNALVTMYAKIGMMAAANEIFLRMPRRDEVTWNALVGGHAENEEPNGAVEAFQLMRQEGIRASYITIVNVLGAFLTSDNLVKHGMPIHAYIIQSGFASDSFVQNSLITMYAKCGDLNSSFHLFDKLPEKNTATWNTIIAATARHDRGEEALKLFIKMRGSGISLDHFGYSGGLAACADLATLEEGQQLHCLVIKSGIDSDIFVRNTAMDLYGKCGEIDDVIKLLPPPINRPRMSWNVLISSFARHGCFWKAMETFQEMIRIGVRPDHVTFVSLLSACSHGGLVDEGLAYYASMMSDFGVPPAIEHCVCIVDLLGRSGRFAEAESFIKKMPVQPNDFIWRSLLASCRIHGNLNLGEKAAKHLLHLAPADDSAYVLYSNICATSGKWEDVESVRTRMGSNRVRKQPACSWVKLKNKVNSFGMGDQSHPQAKQIYAKLEELRMMIKDMGYVPDTRYALHDTDEEQKEHNLWNHSERLALAFGLINCPEGIAIKIFKNLRICGDCHSVFKFVSGIVRRKIVLRDSYRFHHFSDGKCSCSDYW